MSLKYLTWDEWAGPRCKEFKIESPTWKDVKDSILRMNANEYTMICLVAVSGKELVIGGGGNQFVTTVSLGESHHLTGYNDDLTPGLVELTVGGQTGAYDHCMIWDAERILKCACIFWENNTLDSSIKWV